VDLAYLINALVPISIGYAVIRQRVLPLAFIANRGLTLGIVGVIVAMSIEAIVLSAHRFIEEYNLASTIVLAIALIAAAPLIERLKEWVNEFVDRFVFVRLHKAVRRLDKRGSTLVGATSLAEVEATIVDGPCDELGLASAALFSSKDDGSYQRAPGSRGWPAGAAAAFATDDPVVRRLQQSCRETMLRAIVRERSDLPSGAAFPALAVPLVFNRQVEAFVLYGGHSGGTDLTPDEVEVLVRFVRAAGAARAHVQVIGLRREIGELRGALQVRNASR
jgi:hypothetical protein